MSEQKVERLIFESYMAFINNSPGSTIFKNFYAKLDGEKIDVMKDGWLSCALYVSGVLVMFKMIKDMHGTIEATLKDLKESGWVETSEPKEGSVLVWENVSFDADGIVHNHNHVGFYVGNDQAVSNDSWKKFPVKHHWTFNDKRKIDLILSHPELK